MPLHSSFLLCFVGLVCLALIVSSFHMTMCLVLLDLGRKIEMWVCLITKSNIASFGTSFTSLGHVVSFFLFRRFCGVSPVAVEVIAVNVLQHISHDCSVLVPTIHFNGFYWIFINCQGYFEISCIIRTPHRVISQFIMHL